MLLVDYKLRDFMESFNDTKREAETDSTKKFKQVKKELLAHLKGFEKDLTILPGLRIYTILDKNINIEYIEDTGVPMVLNLVWKINDKNLDDIEKIVEKLYKKIGCSVPNGITISNNHMSNVLAVYYENDKTIIINKHTILSHSDEEIEAILKHELIHHKLSELGEDASDISDAFIEEIKKNDAFVSGDPEAKAAFEKSNKKAKE